MWRDQWVPRLDSPLTPLEYLPKEYLEKTMDYLINQTHYTWNLHIVNSLFFPPVVVAIRKIPLSPTPQEDRWILREKRDGNYSVKSAYRIIHQTSLSSSGESSNAQEFHGFWKKLWKI